MRYLIVVTLLVIAAVTAPGEDQPPAEETVQGQVVMVRAIWPDQDLSSTFYRVYGDAEMRELVDVFPAGGPLGVAVMVLRPGDYWIMAVVDVNGNHTPDAGDGIGWYGVEKLAREARPQPLSVGAGGLDTITIPILVTIAEDDSLKALPWATALRVGTLTGKVGGADGPVCVIVMPVSEDGRPVAGLVGEDGMFSLEIPPGQFRVAAVSDADGDGMLGAGDLVTLRGWGEEEPLTMPPDGKLALPPLELSPCEQPPEGLPPVVAGRVTGFSPTEDAAVKVAFCSDESLRYEVVSVTADTSGRFVVLPEPATYYVRAMVDQAGDGKLGAGDMLGFYGVTDLLGDDRPAPLSVPPGALMTGVEIAISARRW